MMSEREKVIKGLEHCTSFDDGRDKFGGVGKCGGCPYYGHDCTDRMKMDALALLNEQEAVKRKISPEGVRCGKCDRRLKYDSVFCDKCGTAVKLE